MRIDTIKQGWYSDLSLQGDKVSIIRDSHIELNGETIALPGENVLCLTMKRIGGITFLSGQGNNSGACLLWDSVSRQWNRIQSTFGFNPCAFSDVDSLLFVVIQNNIYRTYDVLSNVWSDNIAKQIGSQGIRYIKNGRPITGDATYGPQPYGIAQFVELQGGLAVGQSYVDGCTAVYDKKYKIQAGESQFIRGYISGNNICFCVVNPGIVTTFYWMTLDELQTFPVEGNLIENPIPPTPNPIPPIDPPTEPPIPPMPIPIPPVEEGPFGRIEELNLMEPEIVSLVAFDKYARVYNGEVVFDQVVESPETDFEISKPDDLFAIKPVSHPDKYLGMDATSFGSNVCKQVYLTNSRAGYESFFIGVRPSGLIEAVIEYIHQGVNNTVPFSSATITIKRKK